MRHQGCQSLNRLHAVITPQPRRQLTDLEIESALAINCWRVDAGKLLESDHRIAKRGLIRCVGNDAADGGMEAFGDDIPIEFTARQR